MATVIGSSPGAERGMPWLLQAAVHPAGSKLTAQCTLSWRVCCPEAVMAFSIIKEGHHIYSQPFAASCPGSLLWGCNTHINGREVVHKTSLHPPCKEFAPFWGLKTQTPLCCSRHLHGAENKTLQLQAFAEDCRSNILALAKSQHFLVSQPALCLRSTVQGLCFSWVLCQCMIVHASLQPSAPPALFPESGLSEHMSLLERFYLMSRISTLYAVN